MHVHVASGTAKAKSWLEPAIGLAQNLRFDTRQLKIAEGIIRAHERQIRKAWQEHLGR